jgi:hypothetical protein
MASSVLALAFRRGVVIVTTIVHRPWRLLPAVSRLRRRWFGCKGAGTALTSAVIDGKFLEERFEIAHIFSKIISGIVDALVHHRSNFSYSVRVAFVVRKPPVVDFWHLENFGQSSTVFGREYAPYIGIQLSVKATSLNVDCGWKEALAILYR